MGTAAVCPMASVRVLAALLAVGFAWGFSAFVCPQNLDQPQRGAGDKCGGACQTSGVCKPGLRCKLEESGIVHYVLGVAQEGTCIDDTMVLLIKMVSDGSPGRIEQLKVEGKTTIGELK